MEESLARKVRASKANQQAQSKVAPKSAAASGADRKAKAADQEPVRATQHRPSGSNAGVQRDSVNGDRRASVKQDSAKDMSDAKAAASGLGSDRGKSSKAGVTEGQQQARSGAADANKDAAREERRTQANVKGTEQADQKKASSSAEESSKSSGPKKKKKKKKKSKKTEDDSVIRVEL
jgi:hypothetical protein